MVFRHQDVSDLLRAPSCRKDPREALEGPYGEPLLLGDYSILFMDDPDHRRIRSLVTQAFSKRAVEAFRPRTQAIADALLGNIARTSDPADLIASFAVPLPIRVIAEILGVDPADQDDFKQWSDDMALSFDETLTPDEAERVTNSADELRGYIAQTIKARRVDAREDLISDLVAAQDADGTQLSDDEAVSVIALLLFGGNATTTDLIGNGILALLQHPEQLAALRAHPDLIDNAVEETLRFDPSVTVAERIPMTRHEIDQSVIAEREWLCLLLSSANRDPAVHPDPDTFDIRRDDIQHVAFGGGRHFCIGSALARMEAQIAIGSLVARFPRLRLAEPNAEPSYKSVPGFRGLSALEVLLD